MWSLFLFGRLYLNDTWHGTKNTPVTLVLDDVLNSIQTPFEVELLSSQLGRSMCSTLNSSNFGTRTPMLKLENNKVRDPPLLPISGWEELGTRSNGQCCLWKWKVITTIGPKHIPDRMPGIEQLLWPRLMSEASWALLLDPVTLSPGRHGDDEEMCLPSGDSSWSEERH